jgi:hypothetical protein
MAMPERGGSLTVTPFREVRMSAPNSMKRRWSPVLLLLVTVAAGCDGSGSSEPSVTDPTPPESPSTTTSGFDGPVDTQPPQFGSSSTLALADGFGVVCAGDTGGGEAWFVRLEGPGTEPGAARRAVAAFYEESLATSGYEVTWVVDSPDSIVLEGVGTEGDGAESLVSVTIRPTVHSTTVVAAVAIDRTAFGLAADAMASREGCWTGMELDDAAARAD